MSRFWTTRGTCAASSVSATASSTGSTRWSWRPASSGTRTGLTAEAPGVLAGPARQPARDPPAWAGGLARRSGLEAEVGFQDGQSKALAEEGEVLGFELVDRDAGDPVLLARTRPPHGRVGRPGEAALHLEVDQPEPVLEEELGVLSLEFVDVHARTPALLASPGAPHGGE